MTVRSCEICGGGCGRDEDGKTLRDPCLGELDDVVFACCGHGEPNPLADDARGGLGYVVSYTSYRFPRVFTTWIRKVERAGALPRGGAFLYLYPWPRPREAHLVPIRALPVARRSMPAAGILVSLPPPELLR